MAPPGSLQTGRATLAKQLLSVKNKQGVDEAYNVAERSGKLPAVWRQECPIAKPVCVAA